MKDCPGPNPVEYYLLAPKYPDICHLLSTLDNSLTQCSGFMDIYAVAVLFIFISYIYYMIILYLFIILTKNNINRFTERKGRKASLRTLWLKEKFQGNTRAVENLNKGNTVS